MRGNIKVRLLILLISIPFSLFGQNRLDGTVSNKKKEAIDYFDISILNPIDSTLVKGGTFIQGKFIMDNIIAGQYLLKISSLGYRTLYKLIEIEKPLIYDEILLEESSIELQEVDVVGKMPPVVNKDDRYVIKIENTALGDAGNAINALKRTPFVIVDNMTKEISVAGKGSTLILIDNRRVTGDQELKMLNSQHIKQIEIIENPSAKYEAEGQSVINIITNKTKDKGLNADLFALFARGRHNNGQAVGSLTYSIGNILLYSQYGYTKQNSEGYNSSFERYEKEGYSFVSNQKNLKNLDEDMGHEYSFGINYSLPKSQSISLKYDGYYGEIASHTVNELDISKNHVDFPTEIANSVGKKSPLRNGLNLSYFLDNKNLQLSFLTDYIHSSTASELSIQETYVANSYEQLKQNNWESKHDLFSGQLDVIIPLKKIFSTIEMGTKYSNVISNNKTDFYELKDETWITNQDLSSKVNYDENILGAYLLLSGKIGNKTRYNAGIRYEYSQKSNDWMDIFDKKESQKFVHHDFFPSLLITHNLKDGLFFRLSYSRRIARPSYESLNNSVWYTNSYSTRQGNPYLKPTIYNTLSLSSQFFKINATLNASYIEDPNDLLYFNDKVELEKNVVMRVNVPNRWSYSLNLNSLYSCGVWSLQPFLMISYMERSITEDGVRYSVNYPGVYLSLRNQFEITKTLSVDCDLTYNKPAYSFKEFNDQYIFNLAIRQKLLKEKLTLQLACNYTPVKWKQKMDYSYKFIDFTWDGDDRKSISFSIRYNFNSTPKVFKTKSSNTEELNRL